ncbi:LysR family transcriptional regulator [Pseudomonas aeruginosa]|nr:LysR family transcriptional regulator [Pseudomonas aeruginosa]MCQ9860515.1 LysR family transcriptional regulator [Pseudomonas aeruginosa]
MNRNDLRRVDLNLLIVFETLMHERSVTRAAEKLFLGQPAISPRCRACARCSTTRCSSVPDAAWSPPREPRKSSPTCRRRWIPSPPP